MPAGQPRSVPDVEGEAYDEMLRNQRAKAGSEAPRKARSIGHPGFAESLIPVWGSGREAIADFQEGDYAGAALNGALAASDLFIAGSVAKGLAKGGVYMIKGPLGKSIAGQQWKAVRSDMGKMGLLDKYQHGHHAFIPQKATNVPAVIRNHPLNIKGMPTEVRGGRGYSEVHGRIHGPYGGKPQFNAAERYWHGTPAWSKVGTAAAVGHPATAAKAKLEE
jgi:hypothetical protein